MYSLDYVYEDINKDITPQQLKTQIRSLLSNYQLKDNVRKTLDFIPPSSREKALTSGQQAYEDLNAIFEYFDGADNVSPREILVFSQKSVVDAKKQLETIIGELPEEMSKAVVKKISSEFAEAPL